MKRLDAITPEESNAPYLEKADIPCEYCEYSCKNQFLASDKMMRAWDLKGPMHIECAILALVTQEQMRTIGILRNEA